MAYACSLVEVTGGEPLAQKGVYPLFDLLLEHNYTVLLETSGAVSLKQVPQNVIKIVDIKTPSSGEISRNRSDVVSYLDKKDQIKFVIGTKEDYNWAKEKIQSLSFEGTLLFSPTFGVLEPALLADWILEDRLKVRLQVQLHKYIWSPEQRGV